MRLFHEESTTRDQGETVSRKSAGNENAVDHIEKLAIEDPVWEIINQDGILSEYGFDKLQFSNNIRTLVHLVLVT